MARPLRIIYDGAVYHVTLRGNERKAIFRDDQDRERYCRVEDVLSAVCEVFGVERSVLFHQWRGSMIRPMAAQVLCEYSGLTQREVAEILKLQTGAAVSHQIKRLGELMGKTGPLSEKHARIVRIIQQKQP